MADLGQSGTRFIADATAEGTPIVLDLMYEPAEIVAVLKTDQEAERVVAELTSREQNETS